MNPKPPAQNAPPAAHALAQPSNGGTPADGRMVKLKVEGAIWQATFSQNRCQVITGAFNGNEIALWQVDNGQCLTKFAGQSGGVTSVALSADGKHALSGSHSGTVMLWDARNGDCLHVLKGHTGIVWGVDFSADGLCALSASSDQTLRLWDVASGKCLRTFQGHGSVVLCGRFVGNGTQAVSGSFDNTIRLWELASGHCQRVLQGHTAAVQSIACSPDGQFAASGSFDNTVRLWDLAQGTCLHVFEGHTATVLSLAWSTDGRHLLSGAHDGTVLLWDIPHGTLLYSFVHMRGLVRGVAFSEDDGIALAVTSKGELWQWDIRPFTQPNHAPSEAIQSTAANYTNAKVLVVGDTHSGKTGLTERLARDSFTPSESTSGAWATQWQLTDPSAPSGTTREAWLWDFGGQADQRLIHQLYMERCALVLLMFDADHENPLPSLHDWQAALRRSVPPDTPKLLVAGRTDAGSKFNRAKMHQFAQENGFTAFLETSAKEGHGCADLRTAINAAIRWDGLERRSSPRIFKLIKDAILALRDSNTALCTFKELRTLLENKLPPQDSFDDPTLKTVIGLLHGPGVVQELGYGDIILLKPEWINAYAQAVIRTLRADPQELGCLPLGHIAAGKLLFQTVARDGKGTVEIARLPEAEERTVLREMEHQLEQRFLCLRQDGHLVFPSHCGRDRPELPQHPTVFVSYAVQGYLDDIYATLVVKLAQSEAFSLDKVWRDAADFFTLAGRQRMGIKLARDNASQGTIKVYFAAGVPPNEQTIFANYIHQHLRKHSESSTRQRHYVCPHCHEHKPHADMFARKLDQMGKSAEVFCDWCEKRFPLWDDLEQRFADPDLLRRVQELEDADAIKIDTRRKGKLLALEAAARISRANQKCFEIPGCEDDGIDMELEFTDDKGQATGQRLYLQLKSGNSHLRRNKDGSEVFDIKNPRWVDYWQKQAYPVMLVVGTFHGDDGRDGFEGSEGCEGWSGGRGGKEKLEFAQVRWMEISGVLKRASEEGKSVKHIRFEGEPMDRKSILRWRKRMADSAAPG